MSSNKNSRRAGEVVVWRMTEEQRQEYIKKHPIRPYEKHVSTWEWPKKQNEPLDDLEELI
ncbi:hypothetical protein ACFTRE_17660 [Bacillus subtilis]|uniref:hypothetical protein n=1 Tax=Bacillaceae TaxID=186817 RepID=UPI00363805ED